MKRKALVFFLTLVFSVCLLSGISYAEDDVTVYVTVSNAGKLEQSYQPVAVTDTDSDGSLTIFDALTAFHDSYYVPADGEAGNGFSTTAEGFITKLWGVENGGSYGYCLNHASAWSLLDPVADGDYLTAYAYEDLTAWSDMYTFFEIETLIAEPEESVFLVLYGAGYDENWNPVTLLVSDAVLTINGEATEYVTDENGAVELIFPEEGTYVVSASSDTAVLVPPVCVITVTTMANEDYAKPSLEEAAVFTDTDGHWALAGIDWAAKQGYMGSVGDGLFAPAAAVTRASMASVLYRMEGEPVVESENPFMDVADDAWYTSAVIWAAENGLIMGDGSQYRPEDALTRQEAALILYRWRNETAEADANLLTYADADEIGDWAADAFAWAVSEGIMIGTSATTLSPYAAFSRAELALMLMRMLTA